MTLCVHYFMPLAYACLRVRKLVKKLSIRYTNGLHIRHCCCIVREDHMGRQKGTPNVTKTSGRHTPVATSRHRYETSGSYCNTCHLTCLPIHVSRKMRHIQTNNSNCAGYQTIGRFAQITLQIEYQNSSTYSDITLHLAPGIINWELVVIQ